MTMRPIVVPLYLRCFAIFFLAIGQLSAATYTVLTTNDAGLGSFRQAIHDANNNPGFDTIRFLIPGVAPYTIAPTSALPIITDAVFVDGASQPGYSGRPLIQLTGRAAGTNVDGLVIIAGLSRVRGLSIIRFDGHGILLQSSGGNVIEANYLGLDATGSNDWGNAEAGVTVLDSIANTIGGTTSSARNVISGTNRAGVFISGTVSSDNVVLGNFIGVDLTGTQPRGSISNGVLILEAPYNIIGGTAPGSGNLISGNGQSGIYIAGSDAVQNMVQGNYIGTDVSGTRALGNLSDGITLLSAINTLVGGTTTAARNIISGNGQVGVFLDGTNAAGNVVQGNFIGTDVSGSNPIGNTFSGVGIDGMSGNLIGGTTPGARNVISGNKQSGVYIYNSPSNTVSSVPSNNVVQGNFIGTDVNGSRALSNAFDGVFLQGAAGNTIGGTAAGAGNVLSGNGFYGVSLRDSNTTANVIQGNFIGTNPDGTARIANIFGGIGIVRAATNFVGGQVTSARNIISGNQGPGIFIFGTNATANRVEGNIIGLTASGVGALGNVIDGILIDEAHRNIIGGSAVGARNIISANEGSGIYITNSSGTRIEGNFIGLDISGTVARGNLIEGVTIDTGRTNIIGGTALGAGNVISANESSGIYITNTIATRIEGNFIGTDVSGKLARGNLVDGVTIEAGFSNVIGGVLLGAGNLISANVEGGISIYNETSTGNRIEGNLLGTQADGTSALGNILHGIFVTEFASGNPIGGTNPAAGNVIAFTVESPFDGVRIASGDENLILGNAIFNNAGLGIDLGSANVTPNDNDDPDDGANTRQNFPVLSSASNTTGRTVIGGSLNSRPNRAFRIDFYANLTCNAAGYGEGRYFLGSTNVTTPSSGDINFTVSIPFPVPAGQVVTATATDATGNTSEFSACRTVTGNALTTDLSITQTITPATALPGQTVTISLLVSNRGPAHAYSVRVLETLSSHLRYISASPSPSSRFGDNLAFNLGVLSNGVSSRIDIQATVLAYGRMTNSATVTSPTPDTNPGNNSSNLVTTVLQMEPVLAISRNNAQVTISWPTNGGDCPLEQTDQLGSGVWGPAPGVRQIMGDRYVVQVNAVLSKAFYRLRCP